MMIELLITQQYLVPDGLELVDVEDLIENENFGMLVDLGVVSFETEYGPTVFEAVRIVSK